MVATSTETVFVKVISVDWTGYGLHRDSFCSRRGVSVQGEDGGRPDLDQVSGSVLR